SGRTPPSRRPPAHPTGHAPTGTLTADSDLPASPPGPGVRRPPGPTPVHGTMAGRPGPGGPPGPTSTRGTGGAENPRPAPPQPRDRARIGPAPVNGAPRRSGTPHHARRARRAGPAAPTTHVRGPGAVPG